jgi:Cu/Ag efflux protein CusF
MTKLPFTLLGALLALLLGAGAPASAAEPSVSGEVTKIDESAGKITIKHGAIKNLDMEPMTMVFRVKEPAMLKEVKPGDKIKFEADRVNGAITVTEMKLAK